MHAHLNADRGASVGMAADKGEQTRRGSVTGLEKHKPKRSPSKPKLSRAQRRWKRVQSHVRSASLAFSVAGLERRKGFVERKWSTIAAGEPSREFSYSYGGESPSITTAPLNRKHTTRQFKEKTVLFEDNHNHRINR